MSRNAIETVLAKLPGVKQSDNGKWTARCPAHEDKSPSLSVAAGHGGRVLLKCHAGCETEQIVAAMGLTMRDLFADGGETSGGEAGGGDRIVAAYPYHAGDGGLLYEVVRLAGKEFRQRRPDPKGDGGWLWNVQGVRRVLYRLPELLRADPRETVYVLEGEKDVDRLRGLGLTATTNAQGAGKWLDAYSEALRGRSVAVVPDNDKAGRAHGEAVAGSLYGKAADVRIVLLPELPDKGDVSDWLDSGGTVEGLRKLVRDASLYRPGRDGDSPQAGVVLTRVADVKAQPVVWLWPNRIPQGKLTLIAGDPGLGKSFLTLDIAARVSSGRGWPDDPLALTPVGSVVLLSAEDDVADTIRPRLEAARADVERVHVLTTVIMEDGKRMPFSLERDIPQLEAAIARTRDTRLVVIDPISAYLGATDSHKNADVRGLLAPLADLASRHRVALVAVTHLNKNQHGQAIYRAMGSLAFVAAARAAWLVTKDQENPARRLMLPMKNNLTEDATGVAFVISDGVVMWEAEPVKMSTADAMAAQPEMEEPRGERQEAADWLVSLLEAGPRAAGDIYKAARADGIAARTLKRAKREAGVKSKRAGFGSAGHWSWELPDHHRGPEPPIEDPVPYDGAGPLWGGSEVDESDASVTPPDHAV